VNRFWATVCKTARPMLSDRCLSCLSVTFVYCGQTVGWIKMKLATQVGLGLATLYQMGTHLSSPKRGRSPTMFGPYLLWPNGLMDQDATWHGGRSRPRPHVDGDPDPTPPKGVEPPIFGPWLLSPNGWMEQDGTYSEVGLGPATLC